jgi:hypothetical protein
MDKQKNHSWISHLNTKITNKQKPDDPQNSPNSAPKNALHANSSEKKSFIHHVTAKIMFE